MQGGEEGCSLSWRERDLSCWKEWTEQCHFTLVQNVSLSVAEEMGKSPVAPEGLTGFVAGEEHS